MVRILRVVLVEFNEVVHTESLAQCLVCKPSINNSVAIIIIIIIMTMLLLLQPWLILLLPLRSWWLREHARAASQSMC